MEQRRIDEKAREALRGSFELRTQRWSRQDVTAGSVLEARLDDASRRTVDAAKESTARTSGRATDSLEDLAMDYAS